MKKISLTIWLFFILVVMFLGIFFVGNNKNLFIDESTHYRLIKNFANLTVTKESLTNLTTFPFYHFVLGLLSRIIGSSSIFLSRLLSSIFSFFSILVFFLIAKEIEPKKAISKTFQYLFFPILFIFFFLIYTDSFSLLLILFSFYFLNKGKYKTSGFFGLLSVLARQNNVIWLALFLLLTMINRFKSGFNKKLVTKFLSDTSIFIFTVIVLAIFIIFNKGFVLSDQGAHPFSVHFANLFLFLIFHFVLFLPLNISNFPKIFKISIKVFRKKPWIAFPVIIFFIFYIFTFRADHPYNQSTIDYFLRNRILSLVTGSDLVKSLFFIPVFYSILSLAVTELNKKIYYLVYPFILISLCLFWLVEPRYYLVPFVFFILFKKQKSPLIEYTTIIIFIFLSIWIVWGAVNQKFFL